MKIKSLITDTLNKYGLRPKKSLGQNFLINEKIYKDIIEAAGIKRGETVLEIGPGIGTLTDYIEKAVGERGRVLAVEKDSQFVKILGDRFKKNKNVKIINADILGVDLKSFGFRDLGFKIVGNIPYYLTSRLIRTIFEKWSRLSLPELVVLMVQKEVAQRIIAKPPKSNLLATSIQYFSEPKVARIVGKKNFWPKPMVDSAIICLKPRKARRSQKFTEKFFKVARAGFSGKRKQLINSLSRALKINRQTILESLESIKIDPRRRAETLNPEEWEKIIKIYSSFL